METAPVRLAHRRKRRLAGRVAGDRRDPRLQESKEHPGAGQRNLTLGADAAVAAGPLGRNVAAATDAGLKAEIYTYSRSRGLFAGVSLDGSSLRIDHVANSLYYRPAVPYGATNAPVEPAPIPPSAAKLLARLAAYSGTAQPVPATAVGVVGEPPLAADSEAVQS